ncbi:hypothetical protein FHE72_04575 [Rossellomorea vietnamensis]|uniref:ParB/Sulfiredoxin domain-containing protein n=1 Tax=Rossellomorea vietnamensis TaxID=218284 RepID=A0A6I6UQ10_9BACI|nr:hypothetical protein [Rossellomorea vietnamensis]QHE60396.1 hypothetical protein FHE72_04575 [Rossellomorea vietnamensis]
MPETKVINVKDILVNLNNPRFEEQPDEESEIIKILSTKKIFQLMQDISKHGLDPSDLPNLIYNSELKKYIVMEGNRRITAIKVLNDIKNVPSSIEKREKIINQVQKITKENSFEPIKSITCIVYKESDPTLKHFIELKHTGERKGAGRVQWDTESKARFDGSGNFREYLVEFLKQVHPKIESNFGLTTIERIIADPDMRVAIGIILDRKKPEIKFVDNFSFQKLYYILDKLLSKEFNVNDFYHKEDRIYFASKYLINPTNQPWKKRYLQGSAVNPAPENLGEAPGPATENPGEAPGPATENPGEAPGPATENLGEVPGPATENPGEAPGPATENPGEAPGPATENPNSKGKGGRPYKDVSEYEILTKAVPFRNHFRHNARINKTVQELSKIEYKQFPVSSMHLIRSLLESYVNEYIDFFASLDKENPLKMKGVSSKKDSRKKSLREYIYSDIYIHLKDVIKSYPDTYELIHVTFSDNNKASALQIINYHIHSIKHYPDKDEILEAWIKISTVVSTLDTLLLEHNSI